MSAKLEIVDPTQVQEWDDLVLATKRYSIFHCRSWAEVLNFSYKYRPYYFTMFDRSKILSLIPVLEIHSTLTGRRGVSLPFSDFCEPIVLEKQTFKTLFERLLDFGGKAAWKYLEIRGGNGYFSGVRPSSRYLGHRIALNKNSDHLFSNCRSSTQRSIKKAAKAGVECKMLQSLTAIKEFYHLHCFTRKRHGLPPQPFSFFKNIHQYIMSKNLGNVVLASYKNRIIAGAVFFHFGNMAIYKFGASKIEYQNLRANNLIMWYAIKWYSQNGYHMFDMGRTELTNKGLNQFKNGWGTQQTYIDYFRFDFRRRKFVEDTFKVNALLNRVFSYLPVSFLKIIGAFVYKHIG